MRFSGFKWMLCVYLLIELCEEIWVKGMYFNVVDNFNHILQSTVKFRWLFSASQYFSMINTMYRFIFRREFFDLRSETRKSSGHGSHFICACNSTKWPIQFSWYVIIQIMLKILQARLQQYMNREIPEVQAGFRKGRGTRDQIANIRWIIEKARVLEKHLLLLYWLHQSLWLCGSQQTGKFLKWWGYQTTWPAS